MKKKKTAVRPAKPKVARKPALKSATKKSAKTPKWNLRLYVAGQTPKSLAAFANLKRFCDHNLAGQYRLEVVDLVKEPHRAQHDQIVALPTLVRKLPEPLKRVIGDLSNAERVMVAIELEAQGGGS